MLVPEVAVHNDERHYAVDALWTTSALPFAERWERLVYDHVRPHAFHNPKTGEIRLHGEFEEGFHKPSSDLGRVQRAGHPPLHLLVLGVAFLPFETARLLEGDFLVRVSRWLNALLGLAGACLLFGILRRLAGGWPACVIAGGIALLPYSLIFGTLGYADPLCTLLVIASIAYFLRAVRTDPRPRRWAILGVLVGLAVLAKQTGVVLLVCLPALAWAAPPARRPRLLPTAAAFLLGCGVTVSLLCNPFALYEEVREPSIGNTVIEITAERAARYLSLPFKPTGHYRVGSARHPGEDAPIGRVLLTRVYEVTTPAFFGAFVLAAAWLILRGNLRVAPLLVALVVFTIMIPLGTAVRRLLPFTPFLAIVIAWGWMQLRAKGARVLPLRSER